jgi:hypothetical protein
LLNPFSDMNRVYPFRLFAAEHFKQFHGFPQWIPYIFSGMPFAANPTFGDTFYPGFLLRLILPVDLGMTFGMMLHITLAGLFTYLFLRGLKLDWGAAFVGGAAYLFTGMVVSLVTAGHDGKIIVSALLPLALLFLHRGVTRGDWRQYLGFGGVVGLSLLSPQVQMAYYLLMASGFFWLFLAFWNGQRPASGNWWHSGLLFAAGVLIGFGLDGVQLVPFAEYIGFSPRGAAGSSSSGWAYATSYAMPPEELLNVVWPSFSGMLDNYWGRNAIKLHSEYLGIAVLMLASFALLLKERRRLVWFFIALAVYGTLFALGGHTPFYWLPYTLLPGIKLTRAPGMIFFLVSFSTAALAALGLQALLKREEGLQLRPLWGWLGVLGSAALLAAAGGWKGLMVSFAPSDNVARIDLNYGTFTFDAVRGAFVAAAVLGLVLALRAGRLTGSPWALAAGFLVLLDLWSVERRQIRFTEPARVQFAPDGVVQALRHDSSLFRVAAGWQPGLPYFQDNYFSIHRLRSVLGYQGTELHRYDELLGGKNLWRNAVNLNIWRLLAVKYVVAPSQVNHAALTLVGAGPVTAYGGEQVYLYRYQGHEPFASVVAEALKAPDDQVAATLTDQRFDPHRLLLVPPDAPVGVTSLTALPDSVPLVVRSTQPRPGAYRLELETPPAKPAFLFVSENYYSAWQARVDGHRAAVVRAQLSLMAVPIPAGARVVELEYRSGKYLLGRSITLGTFLLLLGSAVYGRLARRGRKREDAGG